MIPINDLSRGFRLYQREDEEKTLEVLRSGWYVLGNEVKSFEEEFASALGEGCFCAGVDNGLDAILVGLMAAGIQPGDEIIVQANGYIATMLGMGLSGVANIGSDVGGFYGPAPEEELFVRWVQNGIFMPRFSIHSTNTDNTVTYKTEAAQETTQEPETTAKTIKIKVKSKS